MKDAYNSEEAKAAREAATRVNEIIHQFGDPNNGDYRDPYYDVEQIAMPISTPKPMTAGVEYQFS